MTSDETQSAPAIRLRCDGAVDETTRAYARVKMDAVLGRSHLAGVTGEVRIVRAAAHAEHPWSATADLHIGGRQVVVVAEEATGREVVDQLQDRLRRQTDRAAHRDADHRVPPWRGGTRPPHEAG